MKRIDGWFGCSVFLVLALGGCAGTAEEDDIADGTANMTSSEAKVVGVYAAANRWGDGMGSLIIRSISDNTESSGATWVQLQAMGSGKDGMFTVTSARLTNVNARDFYMQDNGGTIRGTMGSTPLVGVRLQMKGEIAELVVSSKSGYMTIKYARVDNVRLDPANAQPFVTIAAGKDAKVWSDPGVTEAKDLKISEGMPLEVTQSKFDETQESNARGEKIGADFHIYSLVNVLGKKDNTGWVDNANLVGCAFWAGKDTRCTPLNTPAAK